DVANVRLIGEDHRQPVHAEAHAARRRHAVLQRPQVIFIKLLRLGVAGGAQRALLLEAAPLLVGVVELAERVRQLAVLHEQLPALDLRRIAALGLSERRQRDWIVEDERRLYEFGLDACLEDFIDELRTAERGDVRGRRIVLFQHAPQLGIRRLGQVNTRMLADQLVVILPRKRARERERRAVTLELARL